LAHDHVVDLLAPELDALERRTNRNRAELGRCVALEPAAETAERRADGGDDDAAAHAATLVRPSDRSAREGRARLEPSGEGDEQTDDRVDVPEIDHLDRRMHVAKRNRHEPGRDPGAAEMDRV